ncbi:MAG: preprotein translocase subunit SecG [Paludibacteraceae bacterium]|jgi:preprotein translocase subunit SecG|nr:preprotein translocase subunit SecG [Paludibacteraceae bacterium]
MFGFLIALIVIASILLIVIVLAQNPKGGGLAQGFSGGSQFMGVEGTNKFLSNTTWGLVGFIALASILSTSLNPNRSVEEQAPQQIEQPVQAPSTPAQ